MASRCYRRIWTTWWKPPRLRPRPEIALTTNGVGLGRRAEALALAGLDRVNVSLDSVDAAQFAAITRRNRLPGCLSSRDETDLRGLMRNGATDDDLEIAWRTTMWAKAAGHGINDLGFVQPDRPMSAIGG